MGLDSVARRYRLNDMKELGTAILDAERRRCAAMLANDSAALDSLLDQRLTFHHSNGAVDDKSAYLAKIAGGRIQYVAIDWTDARVTALGPDAALLAGQMTTKVRVEGADKQLDNRVLAVWVHTADEWRMVAFQSTPLVRI